MENYEKKYNKLIEAIKVLQETNPSDEGIQNWVSDNVPELVESEDEKIRKVLIGWFNRYKEEGTCGSETFNGIPTDNIIAWLEKQKEPEDKGEISDGYHTFNELYRYRMLYNAAFFNLLPKELVHKSKKHHDGEECFGGGWFIVTANLPTGQISNHYELKDWDLFQIPEKDVADEWDGHTPQDAADRLYAYLEEQDEQKLADKINNVEPKFHPGDWIITPKNQVLQITDIRNATYVFNNMSHYWVVYYCDKECRLWTIQDAQDGDVLYSLDSKQPFIYKERPQFSQARGYCCINKFGEFAVWNTIKCVICTDKYIPATKEQRDLLFRKMKEAGYVWDGEKKVLVSKIAYEINTNNFK